MDYDWEKALEHYAEEEKIEELRKLVNQRRRKGLDKKCLLIIIDALLVALLFTLVGVVNILTAEIDLRVALVNGVIVFELAIVTFLSPIKGSSITAEEVNRIVGRAVTTDIMQGIRKTVEETGSGIEKWLAAIGACGTFAALVLRVIN